MFKYVMKRIALMLVTLFIIMSMLFVLIRMLPNQIPAMQGGMDKALHEMRTAWGYDEPIMVQYGIFLKNIFTAWDWGFCTKMGSFLQPVTRYLVEKLPYTLYVNVFSMIIAVPLGIFFGIIAAVNKNKWPDHIIQVFIMIFISVPSYVVAFLLQYFVGFKLGWCPLVMKGGNDFASWAMFHSVISGSLIIEQIFAIPGIGKTFLDSILLRDYSVFMACAMFYVAIGLIAGILSDLSYGFIDPRIRMGGDKNNDL